MNPAETHDAITYALLRRLDTCPVRMASRPYLVACWQAVTGDATPVALERLAPWSAMVDSKLEAIGRLIEAYPPVDDAAHERLFAALLFAIELETRGQPAEPDKVSAILFGALELERALRELGQPTAAPAPAPPGDSALAAELASASRLRYGEVSVPLPDGALPRWEGVHPVYQDDGGSVWAVFDLRGTLEEAHAFYLFWASEEGWTHVEPPIEDILRDIAAPTIGVVKGTRKCGLFLKAEKRGVRVNVRLDRTSPQLYDPTEPAIYHPEASSPVSESSRE